MPSFIFVLMLGLYYCSKETMTVRRAEVVVQSGPVEFFEGMKLALQCKVTAGTQLVSYSWLLNGQPVPLSSIPNSTHDQLIIYRTTTKDSGFYMCAATNQFNETTYRSNSSEVLITVKELVSVPDISYRISKVGFQHYYAVVTCNTRGGTPPIIFWLYNRTEMVKYKTVDERNTTFTIPVTLDQHSGWLRCQAGNGNRTEYSKWLSLNFVRVGGPVTMHYKYDIGENIDVVGLRFYCKVEKGSHTLYQWFLNGTLLEGRGKFYWVDHQPPELSILLLSVGRSSAGTYHCEVSDSFDNTTVIKSEKLYFDKDALNRLPVLVVAVVFACFIFLVTVVSVCCCVGVVFRRRHYQCREYKSKMKMKSRIVAYEDKLDLKEYQEDDDVMRAARINESDQGSVSSMDEWPHIGEVKKTLEDEPLEEL